MTLIIRRCIDIEVSTMRVIILTSHLFVSSFDFQLRITIQKNIKVVVSSHKGNSVSIFLAATKQLYKWYFPSVCPSVRLSVTPFSPYSNHRIIMKFSGVITMVKSDVHAKGQGQRSKVKVTEVNTQLSRFRTLTQVWIHIWQWNHAHSWKQHRRGALLFSRSSVKFQGHTTLKIVEFDPDWAFPACNSSLNTQMTTKWCTKLEVA